jgi:predicted dehydrogenase
VHDASVLNPLFGAAPLEVTAMAAVQVAWNNSAAADSVLSVLRYPDGSAGTDRLAFADDSFKIAACSYHEILGDQGAIIIRDAMNQDTAGTIELHTPTALHQSTAVTSPEAAWSRPARPTTSLQARCSTPIKSPPATTSTPPMPSLRPGREVHPRRAGAEERTGHRHRRSRMTTPLPTQPGACAVG